MKAFRLLAAALVLFAPALRAGTFSTAAWTDDATSGIASGQTTWAYHFGSTTATFLNGVTVTGIAAAPVTTNPNFDLAAPTPAVFNNDANTLTTLGGPGSAVIAKDFVYSNQAGGVMSVTVKGLAAGTTYTVSFLSVGWEAAGARLLTFASGADSRSVDQGQFGDNYGIRIDYTFTATAPTRLITLTPQNASFRFHLYGLALRPGAFTTVTTAADSGPGSLRWALVNAAQLSGADTVTFDSALSGQTITLGSEIVINDSAGVTVDASGLPGGITVSGGNAKRLLALSSGSVVTLRRLTLTGGTGVGSFDSGRGGAVYVNLATLTLDRCTLRDNTGPTPAVDGGGIYNSSGTVTLTGCTLSGNTTSFRGGALYNNFGTVSLTNCTLSGNTTSTSGGGICNKGGTLTLTHCTVAGNSATDAGSGEGGGVFNDFAINCTLNNSIVSGNTAGSGFGSQILQDGGTLTRQGANLVSSLVVNTDLFTGATLAGSGTVSNAAPNLAALASNGGPTKTMLPNTGSPAINAAIGSTAATDQRGLSRPQGGTADIGAVETVPASGLVVQNNADSGPGSLRQTLADAALFSPGANNTITFAPALSGQIITLTSGPLILDSDVTIDATALTGGLTISGNSNGDATLDPGESRLFDIPEGVTVVLRRLNLINGMAGGLNGGAIANSGQLTVDQCAISACRSNAFGGGILNFGGTLTLTQSTLSGNAASEDGGGMINAGGGTATLTQSTLSGNSASDEGGGIRNIQSTLTLTQSTLSGNSASFGGGISNTASTLTVTQSTLSGNSANVGGGIFSFLGGTVTLNRSIVDGIMFTGGDNYTGADNLTFGDPLLAPLGNYGGPTQTMPPLPGSPAIDAGGSTTDTTDQRGAPRVADGDGNGSAVVDIGAVEAIPALVTNANDSGAGTLRAALAASSTDIVLFDPSLSGQTITLTSGQLTPSRSVGIDASALAAGITISGGSDGDATLEAGESRLFDIPADMALALRGLHLTNGIADPAMNDATGAGGAIRNSGQLILDLCAISACRARFGGAINSSGVLTARRSTFQQNTATFGGAIHSADNGLLTVAQSTFLMNTALDRGGAVLENDLDSPPGHPTLTRCTFEGNAAARGGAVYSFSLTNLMHCTLSANSASNIGGGVQASSTSVVTLTNCVVAGNANAGSPDLGFDSSGVLTMSGVNLVGDLTGSGLSAGPTLLTGDPLLAPIADYGGPTLTRALLPGSPARDATTLAWDYSDQRGFPIVGLRDLGAYEAGTLNNFGAFAAETTGAPLSPTGDADGDGRPDLMEYATQSDPRAASATEIIPATYDHSVTGAITQANVTFPTRVGATDLIYTLQRSTTLTGGWSTVAIWNATTGVLSQASGVSASRNPSTGLVSVADANVSGANRAFYRLNVTQP